MSARDRMLGAVSWWIGLVGLVAGLMTLSPPMHPAARRHCLLGFAGNAAFIILSYWMRMIVPIDVRGLFITATGCIWFLIVLVNTAAAAMVRDVFFLDAIAGSETSW